MIWCPRGVHFSAKIIKPPGTNEFLILVSKFSRCSIAMNCNVKFKTTTEHASKLISVISLHNHSIACGLTITCRWLWPALSVSIASELSTATIRQPGFVTSLAIAIVVAPSEQPKS